jgi:RimJ/RimL family protein N-acetyltransferase
VIHFKRSFDYELIGSILTHPKIYPHISDDGSPPAAEYRPIESEAVWYIVVRDEEEVLGLWMLHPHNSICWEIHTALLPNAWGERGQRAARLLPEWIWKNTLCRRVMTNVPDNNRLALRFAREAGMTEFGVNSASFLKNGKLWDQVLLGISPRSHEEALGSIEEGEEVCQPQP